MTTESVPPPATPVSEDRTVAILAYITIIGFIIAIILHSSKKTALGAYHLRQTLGLLIASLAFGVAGTIIALVPFIGWIISLAGWLGFLVLWLIGLIAAANGQQKPMPVLGEHFQKWFAGAFA